jgi:membrane fusion protein, hemolysin D
MKSTSPSIDSTKSVVVVRPSSPRHEQQERAFLPAALEIVETPPSPIGRAIGATLVALFCAAAAWAGFGHVDIIASASGKIVPSGRIKLIQPFEGGVVRAIHVHDGQSVRAGEVLIELDPTITEAEQGHIRSDLIAAQLDIARLRAELNNGEDPQEAFYPPAGASADLVAVQRQFLAEQTQELRSKLVALDRQRAQKEADREATIATMKKLDADEPLIKERAEIRKTLLERELGTRIAYLESLQQLTENENDSAIQKSKLAEANAAVAAAIATRAQTEAEFHRKALGELAEAERKAAGLAVDLTKAEQRTKLQLLTAPVDGVVQQLAAHTVGGVVRPAQQLAVVVPSDAVLEVEAMISNRDVGFVHVGEEAQIKVDAFNFTRYGLLHGKVLSVSPDAIARDAPTDKVKDSGSGAEATSSEPKGQELSYAARVSLDRATIPIENAIARLEPGMAVTVEVKTGSRRVIGYLLSPLLKFRQEALRER